MRASATARWWRHDLTRRPWAFAGVALFVAVGFGMLAATVDGARRSSTSVDRGIAAVDPADGIVVPNEPGFDWQRVGALNSVRDVSPFPVLYFEVEGWDGSWQGFPPATIDGGRRWERSVVVAGRLADPAQADEVTISPDVHAAGTDVGDRLTIRLFSMSEALAGDTDPTRREAEVTVVGVAKLGFFSADVQPTYAFFREHEDLIVGESGYVNALVQVAAGAELSTVEREVSEVAGRPVEVLPMNEFIEGARDAVAVETTGLLILAAAGVIATVLLVGQAMARMTAASRDEVLLLRQLGLSGRAAQLTVSACPASAIVVGAAVAPLVAWVVSDRFPIGVARQTEPDPGRRIDLALVVASIAAITLVLIAVMALVSRVATRRVSTAVSAAAADPIGDGVRRLPIGVPAMLGARLALGRSAGTESARAVMWIVATGSVGVVAAMTFAAALDEAIDDPMLFGQGYEAGVALFGEPVDADGLAVLDPHRLTRFVNAVVDVNGQPVSTIGSTDIVGRFEPVVVRGRAPLAADEIGVSPTTLDALGIDVGDSVDMAGTPARVVGEVLVPELGHTSYTSGIVVTTPTLERLVDTGADVKFEVIGVDLPAGTDLDDARAMLSDDLAFAIEPWPTTQRQQDLVPTRPLPVLFAGFVALLMAGSIAHALAATARQRRHEVAVLQVLGLRTAQARRTVFWHAGIGTVTGCLIGAPIGFALGRTLWRGVVVAVPALHRAPGPWPATMLVGLIVVGATSIAAWTARRTARLEPALVLRTE